MSVYGFWGVNGCLRTKSCQYAPLSVVSPLPSPSSIFSWLQFDDCDFSTGFAGRIQQHGNENRE